MIKKCKVLLNNGLNMVVDYDGIQIQMPSVSSKSGFVNIKFENDTYTLCDREEKETLKPKKKKADAIQEMDKPIFSLNKEKL